MREFLLQYSRALKGEGGLFSPFEVPFPGKQLELHADPLTRSHLLCRLWMLKTKTGHIQPSDPNLNEGIDG